MALAERSAADIARFSENTAAYTIVIDAMNKVPMRDQSVLQQLMEDAAKIDVTAIASSEAPATAESAD